MTILPALALLFAQAAAVAPPPVEQDRLTLCLEEARRDPATAIATADAWLAEAFGAGQALPQQCLGQAYVSLLRWDAAYAAFMAGRDALAETARPERARLGAMAGNAALAEEKYDIALAAFDTALGDATMAADAPLAGTISADRARALVGLGRTDEAAAALEHARTNAPQNADVWLLSATLSRRLDDLEAARGQIETAAALAPDDPAVALEAGVIAALSGDDETARRSWNAAMALAPGSAEAGVARGYLEQLGESAE
jgi:tetratricopeptide (TPR) repeat protein